MAALLVTSTVAGCAEMLVPQAAGEREWIVTVDNDSNAQAVLVVADDSFDGPGERVGAAAPNVIPPNTAQEVVFTVPDGQGNWAIFVNPGPRRGPAVLSRDVPADATGELPIRIGIGENGDPFVTVPDLPGWFGN